MVFSLWLVDSVDGIAMTAVEGEVVIYALADVQAAVVGQDDAVEAVVGSVIICRFV